MTRETIPDWLLERYALGELHADELSRVRQALDEAPDGAARLEALQRSNDAILQALPPRVMAAAIRERADRQRSVTRQSWITGLAMLTAVGLGLTAIHTPVDTLATNGTEIEEIIYAKGPLRLLIHRLQGRDVVPLSSGDEASAADRLQLSYRAPERRYGVVASLDGRGVVTVHAGERRPIELDHAGTVSLPSSYELDDAPDFERFFFVAADEPFDTREVLEAIRALDPAVADTDTTALDLPEDLEQVSVTLRKVP